MSITDNIKEFWSHWIEISEEEYQQNKSNKQNFTYIVDQDTNKIVKFLKRVIPCNNYSINTIQCPICSEWILKESKNITKEEYIKMNTNTIENANNFLNRIGAYEIERGK
jgi:hypothetical protein